MAGGVQNMIISVCGNISKGVPDKGAGKSLLCNRLVRPREDELCKNHRSDVSIDEFHSPTINRTHFLYWGTRTMDKDVHLQIIEHTEFVDSLTLESYDFAESYCSRATALKLRLQGRQTYMNPDQFGEQHVSLSNKNLTIDGFILCVDVSKNLKDEKCSERLFFRSLLRCILTKKKPVIIVCTKFDTASEGSTQTVKTIVATTAKKQIPILESSALLGVNTDICLQWFIKPHTKIKPYEAARDCRNKQIDKCKSRLMDYLHRKMDLTIPSQYGISMEDDEIQEVIWYCGSIFVERAIHGRLEQIKQTLVDRKIVNFCKRLPQILKELVPNLESNVTMEGCKKALRCNDKFKVHFTELEDWKENLDFLNDEMSAHIPFEFVDDHQAREVIDKHITNLKVIKHKTPADVNTVNTIKSSEDSEVLTASSDESVEAKYISRRQPDLAKEIQLAEKYDHTYETLEEVVQVHTFSLNKAEDDLTNYVKFENPTHPHLPQRFMDPQLLNQVVLLMEQQVPRISQESCQTVNSYKCGGEYIYNGCFLEHLGEFDFDFRGQAYKIPKHNFTVTLPRYALKCGRKMKLEMAVVWNSPFKLSEGKRQISPMFLLSPQEPVSLLKPLEIHLPHIFQLTGLTQEEKESFGVTLGKAKQYISGHDLSNELHGHNHCMIQHIPTNNNVQFVVNRDENDTELSTCILWLEMKKATSMSPIMGHRMADKIGYCLYCIECLEPQYPGCPQRDVIYFCASLYIKTHQNIVEQHFPLTNQKGQVIHRIRSFPFKLKESTLQVKCNIKDEGLCTAILSNKGKINASSIDMWDQRDLDIKQMIDNKHYPPVIEMIVETKPEVKSPSQLRVNFEGCSSVADESPIEMPFLLPLTRCDNHVPPQRDSNEFSIVKMDHSLPNKSEQSQPTLRLLMRELHPSAIDIWEDIGIELEIDDGQLKTIKSENHGNMKSCLRETMRVWLNQSHPPPSWYALAEALRQLKKQEIESKIRSTYI